VLLHCSALAFAPRQQGLVLAVGYSSSPAAAAAAQLGGSSSSSVLLFEAAGVLRQQLQWTLLGKILVGCRHSNLVDKMQQVCGSNAMQLHSRTAVLWN
jgi:hypothetical protein